MSIICTTLNILILAFSLPATMLYPTSACTLTHINKVQRENTAVKENVHADFIYELSPKMKGKFRIEVKVCVSGTFYTICTCRWVSTNNPTCKDQNNESTCDVESSTLRLSLLVRRTYSEVLWDFLEQSSTPVLLKHIELQVIYPSLITNLTVNGHHVNETYVVDENQKVNISCSFVNGNPAVRVRLLDDTGNALTSTRNREGPLALSLGAVHCHDLWPTVKCEAPGSEMNRSVTLLVKCLPQFSCSSTQVLDLERVLKEGLTFCVRSYTSHIKECLMTRLEPSPATKQVTCNLSGAAPKFNLTLHPAMESGIGEGTWTLILKSELGESSVNFLLTNNTSQKPMTETQRKIRTRKNAIVEYSYDVQDDLLDRVNIQAVAKSSGTKLSVSRSREAGFTTFVIRGTRSQIREALRQITTQTGQWVNILKETHRCWVSWVKQAFPDFENKAYFIPPVYIRRVPTIKKIVSGESVVVLSETDTPGLQRSDIIDDDALQRVLFSLRKFSKVHNEVFVCLSQFPFGSYLGEPSFAPAVAHLPLPSNLPQTLPWSWRRGDFDVLIIHKNYGFVIIEVKAVKYKKQSLEYGRDPHTDSSLEGGDENKDTLLEDRREQVIQKLKAAAEQLNKGEVMLSHLVQDIAPKVNITKIIACPNLTNHEIESVLSHSNSLEQELCQCFHVSNPIRIASSILCSDHLCSHKSFLRLHPLRQWWQEHVAQSGHDETSCNPPDWYQVLIARFCGPASTVTVPSISEPRVSIKTLDKAVAYVGDCYAAHIMLFPEQLELLMRAPPRVFLCGPPGTGKTTLLFLMALQWLRQGKVVFVLSTWDRSIAASLMLVHLLQEKIKEQLQDVDTPGHVEYLQSNFRQKNEVEKTLASLKQATRGSLYVIADEVGPDYFSQYYVFPEFCAKLLEHFANEGDSLHLWAGSCLSTMVPEEPENWQSSGWEKKYLTKPLRSPPSVTEEISNAVEITKDEVVPSYTQRGEPFQTEGPPVLWIHHDIKNHGFRRAEDCEICGEAVARFLRNDLRLGNTSTPPETESAAPTPASLQYKDVLLLSWNELRQDVAILRAMKAASIPVKVMRDSDIGDVATARSDVVWAARQLLVRGLERKVVVCIHNYDDSKGQYISTRLSAMSRCTSQLVVVCLPPDNDSDEILTEVGSA